MNNMDYPQRKVIMHIAVYGNQNRNKIEALRQGQRVMLSNLRAKLDKQGNLEAHVGENSSFQVAILPDQSAQYMVLDTK
jgi:3-phosphoglycerate kinase